MADKPKLALYWAAACGGCEVAVLNTHETLLEVDRHFDFCFCPCLLDTKRSDLEAMPDGSIALTLFNGALRTTENLKMARLLRRKSQVLVAFGSCAHEGCVPALGNLTTSKELLSAVYTEGPLPGGRHEVEHGTLELPTLLDRVYSLRQAVRVDYTMPGCPPESHQVRAVLDAVMSGQPLPPPGALLGAGHGTVCEECAKRRADKHLPGFKRVHQLLPDPDQCLLDQGVVCLGVATRDGCGGLCPKVDMPCIGCYGPTDGVYDVGAKLAGTLGSILDLTPLLGTPEGPALDAAADARLDGIPDWAGTFYKFTLAEALLGRSRAGKKEQP